MFFPEGITDFHEGPTPVSLSRLPYLTIQPLQKRPFGALFQGPMSVVIQSISDVPIANCPYSTHPENREFGATMDAPRRRYPTRETCATSNRRPRSSRLSRLSRQRGVRLSRRRSQKTMAIPATTGTTEPQPMAVSSTFDRPTASACGRVPAINGSANKRIAANSQQQRAHLSSRRGGSLPEQRSPGER